MKKAPCLFLSVLILVIGVSVRAADFPLSFNQSFTQVTGITWLHLGGKPKARRYEIFPGPNRKCTFETYKYDCQAQPCQGEQLFQIRVSYHDPSMNEDEGVIRRYIGLAWKDVENASPFVPRNPWVSNFSSGEYVTKVSYIPGENATLLFQKETFMFSSYTWAKIVTNETYDAIESIRLSFDFNDQNEEMDRWTVLDCQAGKTN